MKVLTTGNIYVTTLRITVDDPVTPSRDQDVGALEILLRVFDPQGTLLHSGRLGAPGDALVGLATSRDGAYLYLADPVNRQVLVHERN